MTKGILTRVRLPARPRFIDFILLILALSVIFANFFVKSAAASDDWEVWQDIFAKTELTDKITLKLNQEAKFRDNFSEYFYIHGDFGLEYEILSWMKMAVHYRHIENQNTAGHWDNEERPHINLATRNKIGDWGVSNRARLERRIRTNASDVWRFRHKLKVTPPDVWSMWGIKPYIADEIFYTIETNRFDQNRLYAGVQKKIGEHFSLEAYYMWNLNYQAATTIWRATNVLGLAGSVEF